MLFGRPYGACLLCLPQGRLAAAFDKDRRDDWRAKTWTILEEDERKAEEELESKKEEVMRGLEIGVLECLSSISIQCHSNQLVLDDFPRAAGRVG